jgi:hypothetical protein
MPLINAKQEELKSKMEKEKASADSDKKDDNVVDAQFTEVKN